NVGSDSFQSVVDVDLYSDRCLVELGECCLKIIFRHFIDDSLVDGASDEIVNLRSSISTLSSNDLVNEQVRVSYRKPSCPVTHSWSGLCRLCLRSPFAGEVF